LYTAILDNAKIQLLPDRLFRFVINLWCVAKEHDGYLPAPTVCAFRLRMTPEHFQKSFDAVTALFDVTEDGRYRPHDWEEHQYESDVSNERVKRWRERQSNGGGNVTGNGKVTPRARDRVRVQNQKTDTDTEASPNGDALFALSPEEPKEQPSWKLEAFNAFWSVVWAKKGTDYARNCFYRKAINRSIADRIIAAAKRDGPMLLREAQAQSRGVLHPSTWLNQGRYDDEPVDFSAAADDGPSVPEWRPGADD